VLSFCVKPRSTGIPETLFSGSEPGMDVYLPQVLPRCKGVATHWRSAWSCWLLQSSSRRWEPTGVILTCIVCWGGSKEKGDLYTTSESKLEIEGTTNAVTRTARLRVYFYTLSSRFFIHQQMHYLLILENSKIYIKTYIKIAPTCFGPRPSSESLHLSLAKVKLMLKQSVLLRHILCCCVVACCHTTA
jgi:hypothetical protein